MTIGFIGLGHVGKALAEKSVQVGNYVILSNRRGPSSLTDYVAELGPLASAGTVAEATQAEVVFLDVRGADIGQALQGLPAWEGRIVVDTNNAILADGTFVDLDKRTSSELLAAQLPGARVVKAFNSLFLRQSSCLATRRYPPNLSGIGQLSGIRKRAVKPFLVTTTTSG
jgi:predicted dinucleotide-binding enzyme